MTRRRLGSPDSPIARNAHPRLRVQSWPQANPYASLRAVRRPLNAFQAYREFVRRMRHAT